MPLKSSNFLAHQYPRLTQRLSPGTSITIDFFTRIISFVCFPKHNQNHLAFLFLHSLTRIVYFFCFSLASPESSVHSVPSIPFTNSAGKDLPFHQKFKHAWKPYKNFRKGIFLTTAVIICLSYLITGVFLKLSINGLIPANMATQLNFIPMAMVILAYMGHGLGFGVVPGLLAAETIPVNIR